MKKFCGGLFAPLDEYKPTRVWKTFGFFRIQGITNQALLKKAALQMFVFGWYWAKRPEFQKDEFLVARFPVSSRAFSG